MDELTLPLFHGDFSLALALMDFTGHADDDDETRRGVAQASAAHGTLRELRRRDAAAAPAPGSPKRDLEAQRARVARETDAATDVAQSLRAAADTRLRTAKTSRMDTFN